MSGRATLFNRTEQNRTEQNRTEQNNGSLQPIALRRCLALLGKPRMGAVSQIRDLGQRAKNRRG